MTTTTCSSNNRNDGPHGLKSSVTEVIPLEPVSTSTQTKGVVESRGLYNDELEDDIALEVAFSEEEEKFIDEEISSYDEEGRPIVDTEALEQRNLTTALVQSCADHQQQPSKTRQRIEQPHIESSSSDSSPTGDKRRYGLRPRSCSSKATSTPVPSQGSYKRGRPPRSEIAKNANEVSTSQQPLSVPLPPTKSLIENMQSQPPPITSLVPNPLVSTSNSKPLQPPPSILLPSNQTSISSSSMPPQNRTALTSSSAATASSSNASTLSSPTTTPLTSNRTVELAPVPTKSTASHVTFEDTSISQARATVLTASVTTATPKPVSIAETAAIAADLPFLATSQNAPTSRGRIFSIDFDPGFDFSDMALDMVQATEFGPQQLQQSLSAIPQHNESTSNAAADVNLPIDLPAVSVNEGGRNRAFSFEFFSFLADEAPSSILFDGTNTISATLPMEDDMPDPIMSTSMGGIDDDPRFDDDVPYNSRRPRGDSIIFDPVSFQDGGIHETNALAKVGRSESVSSSNLSLGSQAGMIPCLVPSSTTSTTVASNDFGYNRSVPDAATSCAYTSTTVASSSQQTQTLVELPTTTALHVNPGSAAVLTSATTAEAAVAAAAIPPVPSTASPFPMELLNKDGRIGIYLPKARKARIARFHAKRKLRIWRKRIKYDCRKKLADSRPRIKGRFVKRSELDDEE